MSRLKDFYREEVVKQLQEQFGYKSVMEVPRITKITLNMGVGEALTDKKVLENAVSDMEAISGQKAVVTKARKSVAVSRFVKAGRLVVKLHYAVSVCMTFLIA